jgi:hypothetical protein
MTLTPELIRVYASAPVDEFYYETLTLSHPLFSKPWHITNYPKAFTAVDEKNNFVRYEPYPFEARLPSTGENGTQDIQFVISNVSRLPVDEIDRAAADPTTRVELVYRAYASTDLTKPGLFFDDLSISEITVTENTIVANASASDLLNRTFPNQLYTTVLFPGLAHVF